MNTTEGQSRVCIRAHRCTTLHPHRRISAVLNHFIVAGTLEKVIQLQKPLQRFTDNWYTKLVSLAWFVFLSVPITFTQPAASFKAIAHWFMVAVAS